MEIKEIKRMVDLLKKANNKSYCLVQELAKEMGIKKTGLMQIIVDNPKLFDTGEVWTYKRVPQSFSRIKNKNLGLGIKEVYIVPEDNYRTDEWLKKKTEDCLKYIHISEFDNYGRIEGYYIEIDKDKDSRYREYVWRNTENKIKDILSLGVLHKYEFIRGGWGDCCSYPVDYAIDNDGLKMLKECGWEFNSLSPINK